MDNADRASPASDIERRAFYAERPGFRIQELQLSPNQEVPWDYHHQVQETLYVLEGQIRVSLREPDEDTLLHPERPTPSLPDGPIESPTRAWLSDLLQLAGGDLRLRPGELKHRGIKGWTAITEHDRAALAACLTDSLGHCLEYGDWLFHDLTGRRVSHSDHGSAWSRCSRTRTAGRSSAGTLAFAWARRFGVHSNRLRRVVGIKSELGATNQASAGTPSKCPP